MGVDYSIGFGCVPKERMTTDGIIRRLKAGEQAASILEFYRQNNDQRAIDHMGGEVTLRTANGETETRTVLVKDLLAEHAELDDFAPYCEGCPANRFAKPFGCIGRISYPISAQVELWMLYQLPSPEEPLPYLLLSKAEEMGLTGAAARQYRDQEGVIFQNPDTMGREYPEMKITADQLFELLFMLGSIQPKRAVMILMYLNAIRRDMEASELMALTPTPSDAAENYPFQISISPDDDYSTRDFKQFLYTLHLAWLLGREVILDV